MDSRVMSLRAQRWKQIIVDCNTSGMKKAEWMRQHGVSEKSFYRWQTILRDQVLKAIEELPTDMVAQSGISGENQKPKVDGFVDITAMIAQRNDSPTTYNTRDPITHMEPSLMLQAGPYNLYIGNGITEATLATVLRVIGHA